MDIRAIILLGTPTEASGTTEYPISSNQDTETDQLMGYPIAALDLLGQPVLCHVIDRLRSYGISGVTVLSATESLPQVAVKGKVLERARVIDVAAEQLWARAEEEFFRISSQRPDSVLVIRVGPYAEVDFDQLLKFHISRRNCATAVWDKVGNPLDILALDPSRKIEAASVLRRKLRWNWRPSEMFHSYGYVNLLQNGADFRALAEDALMRRCALIPRAQEIKPGVWVGKNASIHATARIEGPAFIGKRAKIGSRTVLSGCSTIEDHAQIDQESLVSNSTVLPYTYVGKSLNVMQSVIGFEQIAQVNRGVTVAISDAKLTRTIASSPIKRTLHPMRTALSLMAKRFSGGVGSKGTAESDARPAKHEVDVLKEVVVPQKAHAAAASASRAVKGNKRASGS